MKTALVHDWLTGMGGGEKVLENVCQLYSAPIYTLVRDPAFKFASSAGVHTSFLQKLPKSSKYFRSLLPLFPFAIEQFDLKEYELVLSFSHAVAKGVLTHAEQLHLCYCFTPMRYAWDLYHTYMEELKGVKRLCAKMALHRLRQWDVASQGRVDHFAAISHTIARRIKKTYRREAAVIYPPVATHKYRISPIKESYYVTLSRLVPYKKIDLIVEAFAGMPDKRLLVIGDGPEMGKVKAKAAKNVEILGFQPDEKVREYIERARAFVFAAEEDFGIVVVEAQAAGVPVIAFGRGGSLETVLENETGLFFPDQTAESIAVAVEEFEKRRDEFDPQRIKAFAESFNEMRFRLEFKQFVDQKIVEFHENRDSRGGQRHAPLARL